jgi:hypothetical protein
VYALEVKYTSARGLCLTWACMVAPAVVASGPYSCTAESISFNRGGGDDGLLHLFDQGLSRSSHLTLLNDSMEAALLSSPFYQCVTESRGSFLEFMWLVSSRTLGR